MKKLKAPFETLPKGVFRLIIVFAFVVAIIIGIIQEANVAPHLDGFGFLIGLAYGFIFYWIIAWVTIKVGLWVYEGFKEDQDSK